MSENLFAYGTLKTGGPRWAEYLAPRVGMLAAISGVRLYRIEGSPAVMAGQPDDLVYGELFRGVPDDVLTRMAQAVDAHYQFEQALTTDRTPAYAIVVPSLPHEVVWGPMPDSTWRTRDLTRGLNRLCREALIDLGDKPSEQDRKAFAIWVRDEIRPLVQANWVGIPWRTGPNIPEWKLCQAYMERLAVAAEIGL